MATQLEGMKMDELDKRRKALSERLKRERRTPAESGIWYHVFLPETIGGEVFRSDWQVIAFRPDEHGEITHAEAWERHVVPVFAAHHGLDADRTALVKALPLSMPRGLMARAPKGCRRPLKEGLWYFTYGGDLPSVSDDEVQRRHVINAFHLNLPAAQGLLRWKVSADWTMASDQQEALRRILGVEIPY